MSIIVKGMKMPTNCKHCPFIVSTICYITNKDNLNVRQDDCPLVEIPEKHGDLIDRDWLMDGWMDLRNATKYGNKTAEQQRHSYSTLMMYEIADAVDDAPTIFEAE